MPAEQFSATLAGWYDDLEKLFIDAKRLKGISGFVTVNPVSHDLLARSHNKLSKVKHRTTDADILRLYGVYFDFDPIRPADISSTDDELAASIAVRDQVLADWPMLAASSFWGRSGNGGYIYPSLASWENTPENIEIVKAALEGLAYHYNNVVVKVDTTTFNPARVMALPGTMKCKGSNVPARPYRMATIDGQGQAFGTPGGGLDQEFFKSLGDLKGTASTAVATATSTTVNVPITLAQPIVQPEIWTSETRARRYVQSCTPAISGQNGHNTTLQTAIKIGPGFDLPEHVALSILRDEYNPRCVPPWDDHELARKVGEAYRVKSERGWLIGDNATERLMIPLIGGPATPAGQPNIQAVNTGTPVAVATPAAGSSTYGFTDVGNARRLVKLHGDKIRYCKSYNSWMIYDGTRWVPDDRCQIEKFAKDVAFSVLTEIPATQSIDVIKPYYDWSNRSQSSERVNALIKMARSEPGITVIPKDLDPNPWDLNVKNGTIDLETFTLRPHRPSDMITKLAPVTFQPDATCQRWDRFAMEIFNDDFELVEYISRCAGYSISGVIREHALILLQGNGRNGKTVFLNTLHAVLGDYSTEIDSDLLLEQFSSAHPTGLTELQGRRMVVANEVEQGRHLAEALVKKLTGGNPISARKMHRDFYTFNPTHKIWLAANDMPNISGQDHGIWGRIRPIQFLACFDPGVPGGRKPDTELEEKLKSEASGILNWLLHGCKQWQANGLGEPLSVREFKSEYKENMDVIGTYLKECCVLDPLKKTPISGLYQVYVEWAGRAGYKNKMTKRAFGMELKKRNIMPGGRGGGENYRLGIVLKPPAERCDSFMEDIPLDPNHAF